MTTTTGTAVGGDGPPGSNVGDSAVPYTGLALSADAQAGTGAAVTAIPIDVPPGRNNMKPNLVLAYASVAGPTPFGNGWDLPLGMVTRSTRLGRPRYDSTDTFVVTLPDGALELLPLNVAGSVTTYGSRIDESHAKVTSNSSTNTFTLRDKSGRVYTFGATAPARTGPTPTTFAGTFAWHVTSIADANNNTITIAYTQTSGWAYPDTIHYGANPTAAIANKFRITFAWLDNTSPTWGVRTITAAGFRQDIGKRIDKITVAQGAANVQVREYRFSHTPSPTNLFPLLSSVQLSGTNPATVLTVHGGAAATTNFSYYGIDHLDFGTTGDSHALHTNVVNDCSPPDGGGSAYLDMNGDGLVDLVKPGVWTSNNPHWDVYLNQGRNASTLFATSPIPWALPKIYQANVVGVPAANVCATQTDELDVRLTTVDMNGDHLPDFVDARATNGWVVQLNEGCNAGNVNCRFSSSYIQLDLSQNIRVGHNADRGIFKDLIDLNGDGMPDALYTGAWETNGHKWQVRWNRGTSMDPPVLITVPSSINYKYIRQFDVDDDTEKNRVISDFFDINGDGLPDKVVANTTERFWSVRYWNGNGFTGGVADAPDRWEGVPRGGLRVWQTATEFPGTANTGEDCDERSDGAEICPLVAIYDVFDVTGDGLPDVVDAQGWRRNDRWWRVFKNTGRGFEGPTFWSAPFFYPIRYQGVWTAAPGQEPDQHPSHDMFDIDGDGYVDYVNTTGDKVWFATPITGFSTSGNFRADALYWISTPLGNGTFLFYDVSTRFNTTNVDPALQDGRPHLPFPVWTVREIWRWPSNNVADVQKTFVTQDGGYYDGGRREFRGFATASKTDPYGVVTQTTYHQSDVLRGKMKVSALFKGNTTTGLLTQKTSTWQCRNTNGTVSACPGGASATPTSRYFPVLTQLDRLDATSNTDTPWNRTATVSFRTNYTYDDCGNVTQDVSTDSVTYGSSPNVMTSTASFKPGCDVGFKVCNTICDRPELVAVVGGLSKQMTYDDGGNLKTVQLLGEDNPITRMDYDAAGNLIRTTDPRGTKTTVTYDDADDPTTPYDESTRIFKKVETVGAEDPSNPRTLVITTKYDPRFGKLTSKTSPDGAVTTWTYDDFGRLSAVYEPGSPPNVATRRMTYDIGESQAGGLVPYRVDTEVYEPNRTTNGGYLKTSAFFDGLGRLQQVQTTQEVQGNEVVVVNGAKSYELGKGRVTKEFAPVATSLTNTATRFTSFAGQPGMTLLYDDFGRITRQTQSDGTIVTTTHARARIERKCDALRNANSSAGVCTETEVDGFGRVVAKRSYSGSSSTAYGREESTYDAAGREVSVRLNGNAATTVVTQYDALGRSKRVTDPNSGTWVYTYDANGNVVVQDDPAAGQHLTFRYDRFNRLRSRIANVQLPQGNFCRALATYQYDTSVKGRGRLSRVDDVSGSTAVAEYDSRGNAKSITKTIRFGNAAHTFTTERTYDALGRLDTETVPYTSLQNPETLYYGYSAQGLLQKVRSDNGAYVTDIDHDLLGRTSRMQMGNGTVDARTYRDAAGFGDAGGGYALHGVTTTAGTTTLRNVTYADYDPNGKILSISDANPSGLAATSVSQTVAYADPLNRLSASSQSGGAASTLSGAYQHDAYGRITSKDGAGYAYNPARPHQLTTVAGQAVTYDANGSMSGLPGSRALSYDPQGQLVRVLRAGYVATRYVYDFSGARVVTNDVQRGRLAFLFGSFDLYPQEGRIIRHLGAAGEPVASSPMSIGQAAIERPAPPTMLARNLLGGMTVLAFGFAMIVPGRMRRGIPGRPRRLWGALLAALLTLADVTFPAVVAAQCADPRDGAPPEASLFYHMDHLGGPQLITDAFGGVVERIVQRPYGQVGGAYDAGGGLKSQSDGTFGFTGHRLADSSGLIYMGARFYDPALAMFVSRDPAGQLTNPYSYVGGDPINARDPTGLLPDLIVALIIYIVVVALSAAAAGIAAAVNGASASEALEAAGEAAKSSAISGAIALVGGVALAAISPALAQAASVISAGMTAVNAFAAAVSGNWEAFGVAVASFAVGMALGALLRDDPQVTGETTADATTQAPGDAYQVANSGATTTGPPSRKDCVLAGGGCTFRVSDNPKADGGAPWYELPSQSDVDRHATTIDRVAAKMSVDGRLIRSVMYVETTHGYYDAPAAALGMNKSILPMNVNQEYWGDAIGSRADLARPLFNIRAGARILSGITANLPPGSSIAKIATLYNNLSATTVSNYGARVEAVYNAQPWQ